MNFELDHISFQKLSDVCHRYYVRKLSLFGSRLHGTERADSDLDVLVEFMPGHVPGFAFISLQDELSSIFGQPVDLRTPKELSKYFRDAVVQEAKPIFSE
jgi:hypothetical protein